MDQLINSFCAYILLINSNMNSGACQAALKASYVQSGGKVIVDTGQSFYSKKGEELIKDNINDNITYSVIGLYVLEDIYKKKEVKVSTPCNMKLCDSIGFDVTNNTQSYNMGWKWEF
jgi:hypothetical protein